MGAHMDVSFRSLAGALAAFETTLAAHPEWPVSTFFGPGWKYGPKEKFVVLALLAKDLGHFPPGDDLFMGQGLARAVIGPDETPEEVFALLKPGGRLLADGVLRPCQGWTDVLSDDDSELADVEFELTEETLRKIGLEKTHRKKASGDGAVREPRVRLEQLVLSEEVREALRMAAAQVRNMDRLMGNWGLGKVLSYGRGMTLLFSGPPGVGKTACAEALAAEIGRPILVADYSEIENCFVGQTEKNVVRLFRDAKAHGAVLFLDEAEAMFYDRETAVRSWEGRDVNVLLQQIEKFDGVCILATNLKVRLDRALARRIRLKVEFAPPDRDDRLEIWKRLLPPELPLATDVDLAELAEADLTGGEIKNAVLNAATRAVARPDGGPVTAEDFRAAVEMELRAKKERLARIGFGTRDRPDGPPGPDCGS
jgi:AAA+ superfamily predicted ATPase